MPKEPWDDPRITTFGLLLEAHAAVVANAGELDVPQPWVEVLLRLARSGGRLRMTELATQVRLSGSGLTRLIDRMAAEKLVKRAECPEDGRGLYAALTPRGESHLRRVLPEHLEAIERLLVEPLGRQLPTFERLLRTVRDAASPPDAHGGADDEA
jgi:DNA-binding MarR family transcriptional regulator